MNGCNGMCWSVQSESFDQVHEVCWQGAPLSPVSPTFPDEANQPLSPIALDPLAQRAQGKPLRCSHVGERDVTLQERLDQGKAFQRLFSLRLGSACKLGEMFGHWAPLFRQLAGERRTRSTCLSPPRPVLQHHWSSAHYASSPTQAQPARQPRPLPPQLAIPRRRENIPSPMATRALRLSTSTSRPSWSEEL